MRENKNEAGTDGRQEIENLREENSKLRDEMLVYTGLAGQMHRQDKKMEQLKALLIRAAEALEKSSDAEHSELVQALRNAAQ